MTPDTDHNQVDANPYGASKGFASPRAELPQLTVPAWIAIVCCTLSLGFWIVTLVVSLPFGNPNAPPLIRLVVFIGFFMILPAVGLFGSIAMLRRERYGTALAAASAMMVPVLGPCFGLTLPIGVWTIILLRRDGVRKTFAGTANSDPDEAANADDAIVTAAKLATLGDWHASIDAYRLAAERWPEHAHYIENCIADVQRRIAASN